MRKALNLDYFKSRIDSHRFGFFTRNFNYKNMYIPDGYDEATGYKKPLRMLTLMVTTACNFKCTYCFEHTKEAKCMTFKDTKKAIDIFFGITDDPKYPKYKLDGRVTLNIMGGEPMLQDKLAYDTIKYFEKIIKRTEANIDWDIWIPSNGTNYDSKWVNKICRRYKSRLIYALSVDGCKECHDSCRVFPDGSGTYDFTKKALDHAIENKYIDRSNPGVKFTISPSNLKYFKRSMEEWMESGYKVLYSNWEEESYYSPEVARDYYYQCKEVTDYIIDNHLYDELNFYPVNRETDEIFDRWTTDTLCNGGGYTLTFYPGGDIYACNRMGPNCVNPGEHTIKLGSLEEGIGPYSGNEEYEKNYRDIENISRYSVMPYHCYNCEMARACSTCIGNSINTYGTMFSKNVNQCNMTAADNLVRAYGVNRIYREKEKTDPNYFFESFHLIVPIDQAIEIIGLEEYNLIKSLAKEIEL